jgi:hypothetical protein
MGLYIEEIYNLYLSPNIIKDNDVGGARGTHGRGKNIVKYLVKNLEGKKPLDRSKHCWQDGIRMHLRDTDLGVWSGSSWLRIGTGGGLL